MKHILQLYFFLVFVCCRSYRFPYANLFAAIVAVNLLESCIFDGIFEKFTINASHRTQKVRKTQSLLSNQPFRRHSSRQLAVMPRQHADTVDHLLLAKQSSDKWVSFRSASTQRLTRSH